jgi:hypothetical protein
MKGRTTVPKNQIPLQVSTFTGVLSQNCSSANQEITRCTMSYGLKKTADYKLTLNLITRKKGASKYK